MQSLHTEGGSMQVKTDVNRWSNTVRLISVNLVVNRTLVVLYQPFTRRVSNE